MRIGLVTLDRGGGIALFNLAAEQILGYDAEEVRGRPFAEIFTGLTDLLASLGSEGSNGKSEMQVKRNARHKDGRIISLVVTPYVTPDNSNPAAGNGVMFVFHAAQELEKMEKQLQHLDRLHSLDEFAAGIVHEIRNPLAGISINAQHIVEQIGKHCQKFCTTVSRSERFQEEMQDILADVRSIESIVKKVLDFAHPDKSQVRETSIDEIVREVLRFSRMPLRRRGIRLLTDLNKSSTRVKVDVSQMKQVFFNMVRNACEAMPEGGELRVSTARLPHGSGQVRVEVKDTGRGIGAEYLERIFDPFFSMHREGTGLGLAISRKIVETHGGRIEVESRPGKGTMFAIVLPTVCEGGYGVSHSGGG